MNNLYKFSPALIFVVGYFLWNNHSPIVLAGNAIIVLGFVMLLALIPTGIIYVRNIKKRPKQNSQELLDQQSINDGKQSFYLLLSKYTFYIGIVVCALLVIMRISYSR